MKNTLILAGALVASTLTSQAAEVYTSGFDTTYFSNNGATILGGSATPDVSATDWFGSSNGVSFGPTDLSFSNTTANRYRGSGVWLDTTGWATGLVTVEVNATSFSADANTSFLFQAYAANGVNLTDSGVSLDLHGAEGLDGTPVATGTASIATLGAEQSIVAAGTNAFTFNYNGTDQFVALTFVIENIVGATTFGSATLDNLTVNTVPEPSTYALLAGLTGLTFVMLRRRRA